MIIFNTVKWKNLLSTGNSFTEIRLDEHATTLMIGDNGAGKSTFIEAIFYALFGVPYRDINKPSLLNSINKKGLLVELEFTIGIKKYMVRRGMKPNVFEIWVDGNMLNQEAAAKDYQEVLESNILKMTRKSFAQIVTLGSSTFVPFMQLKAKERRDFIEDILDIQIFSTMNELLKKKIDANKEAFRDSEKKLALCEQKIDLNKKHIASMKQNNDELIALKQEKIVEYSKLISVFAEKLEENLAKKDAAFFDPEVEKKLKVEKKSLDQFKAEFSYKIGDLKKHIDFLNDHDDCPTCRQTLDPEWKLDSIATSEKKRSDLHEALSKLAKKEKSLEEKFAEIEKVRMYISDIDTNIRDSKMKIATYERYNQDVQEEIDNLQKQTKKIETDGTDLEATQKELEEIKALQEELTKQREILSLGSVLLKDGGIKTKIIKQYIPIMNKLINKYLATMDFFVQFELNENFEESIKSRFRDDFTYPNFSEGEKARIDLALLFTWRSVAKIRNSASTNLLIFDEVLDGSSDKSGIESFFSIINDLKETNVFVISHREQPEDRFNSVIEFKKVKNFSQISVKL
jgi:DNA repair exonuclease SbcCD ATPase subunit